ncbi:adenine methyltransferase [Candidatus Pacearchaeota archaeon]|nr:adenine methyltransferase [Candidatus Pacearchaeota archaeon]
MQKSVSHLAVIGVNDKWETPSKLLVAHFIENSIWPKLDVCTTKAAAKRAGFHKFFTRRDNPLKKNWKQDFFMNPPYSQIETWIDKAYKEHMKWSVNGVILTYAKTDTKWWHKYVEGQKGVEVHFIKGRIKFLQNGKPSKNSAPYPSCFIHFLSGL